MAKKRSRKKSPIGRSLESYSDFRYLDEQNRQFWRSRYLDETGRENARGWNASKEFKRYEKNREKRIDRFAKKTPGEYIDKAKYIERKAETSEVQIEEMAVFNSLTEIDAQLQFYSILAKNRNKAFFSKMELNGREYIGGRAITDRIAREIKDFRETYKEIEKELRRIEKAFNVKIDSPPIVMVNGTSELTNSERSITISFTIETNLAELIDYLDDLRSIDSQEKANLFTGRINRQ